MDDSVRYATGDWLLVARESGLLLVPRTVPVAVVDVLWETLDHGDLAQVLDALTEAYGMSLAAIPPFAIVTHERTDMRIAVRGTVRVACDDGTRQHLVTGGRVHTWVEQTVAPNASLVITPPEAGLDQETLPIVSGVVRAGLVTFASGEGEADDARHSQRESLGTVAPEAGAAAPVADRLGAFTSSTVVPEAITGALADEAVIEAEEIVADVEAVDDAEEDAAAFDASAQAEAAAVIDAEEEQHADDAEVHGDSAFGGLFARLEGGGADRDVDHTHDEGTDAPVPDESTANLSDREVDQKFQAIAGQQLVDAPLTTNAPGDHDGNTQEQASRRAPTGSSAGVFGARPAPQAEFPGRAVLSTGRVLTLERVLVIGRRPRVTRTAPDVVPALIAVESPTHDISRNHLEIRREGDTVLVTDLDTTNGTVLLRGTDAPRRLHPGEASLVISGDVIDIGDEVTITFEDIP